MVQPASPNARHIAIVDYGMGNLRSVAKATEAVAPFNTRVTITDSAQQIEQADAVIFPGQGAARSCMQALQAKGLDSVIQNIALEKPFLGICMGLQVLMHHSEENNGVDCLNLIPGRTHKFDLAHFPDLKLPHMGWNPIHQTLDHPLWHNIAQDDWFYFVHSYYVIPEQSMLTAGQTTHGQTFCSALAHQQLFAIQAHPEKSADAGLQLLKNFINWRPA